jgi:hypothetical protein
MLRSNILLARRANFIGKGDEITDFITSFWKNVANKIYCNPQHMVLTFKKLCLNYTINPQIVKPLTHDGLRRKAVRKQHMDFRL